MKAWLSSTTERLADLAIGTAIVMVHLAIAQRQRRSSTRTPAMPAIGRDRRS